MKEVIDNLNVITGWSGSGGASIDGLNEHLDFVAGYNTKSIVFNFNGEDSYVEKTYGTDVSDYNELTLYLFSKEKRGYDFKKIDDFSYKIDLGTGKEYYLPTWDEFTFIVIDISSIDTIDRIRITALHDDDDYMIMSYIVTSIDEVPFDIFDGIKDGLETYRDDQDAFLLGTVNINSGDNTIDLSNFNFIDNYAVIKIDDGVNSEIHQLMNKNEETYEMSDLYDGNSIVNNYVDASVYLYLPIEFGRDDLEAIVPGIMVWGFEPEEVLNSFNIQHIVDSWSDSGVSERKEGHCMEYPIQFDCEARQNEILAFLAQLVRNFIGRKFVYINGRKFQLDFDGGAVETKPTDFYDVIPKVLYRGTVEIKEELWERRTLPITTTIDIQVTIQ